MLGLRWDGDDGKLKDENPKMYAFAKARVLALGYGAGWAKFIMMAAMYISKEDLRADLLCGSYC